MTEQKQKDLIERVADLQKAGWSAPDIAIAVNKSIDEVTEIVLKLNDKGYTNGSRR